MQTHPLTLALQGGGTHGAFGWGAVDQILLDGRFRIDAITAASGGAFNAVILADALTREGPDAAREQLKQFWRKVNVAAGMLPFRTTVVDKMLANVGIDLSPSSIALDYFTKIFSPYQFNLFDLNPLRGIVEEMVDFEALRAQTQVQLFINTTQVKSGKGRVFTTPELSLDVVMASACLPFLFKTVEIEGEPYWDGGYCGNPALTPLLEQAHAREVLLVQSAPAHVEDVPTKAADILDRATEISFNNALAQQLQAVELYNRYNPQALLHMHTVEANELLGGLGRASKLNTDWDFLLYLHDIGAQAAADWLEEYRPVPVKKAG